MLHGKDKNIMLMKGDKKIKFDIMIPIGNLCMLFLSRTQVRNDCKRSGTSMSIQLMHELLGHCYDETARSIEKQMG